MKNRFATHVDPASIFAYEAGEMDTALREQVAEHLAACAICRAELELVKSFREVSADATLGERSAELSAAFGQRLGALQASVDEVSPQATPWRRPLSYMLIAASLALVVVGLSQLGPRDFDPVPSAEFRQDGSAAIEVAVVVRADGWRIAWVRPETWPDAAGDSITVRLLDKAGQIVLEQIAFGDQADVRRADLPVEAHGPLFVRVIIRNRNGLVLKSDPQVLAPR